MASGQLTSKQLTEALLDRIERLDDKLHAFVTVYAEDALQAACRGRLGAAIGAPTGTCARDPGRRQRHCRHRGSCHHRAVLRYGPDRISPVTATLVKNMIAAGMIILGKTHTVEFAMGSFGTNQHMGTPWNPLGSGTAADPRRFKRRIRSQCCSGHGPLGHRHRTPAAR